MNVFSNFWNEMLNFLWDFVFLLVAKMSRFAVD